MHKARPFTRLAGLLTSAVAAPAPSAPGPVEPFLGAWQLSALEEMGADGQMHAAHCTGLLAFTPDHHMSVQVMYENPTGGSSTYSQGGYEASFGTYEVDVQRQQFVYHVQGALVRAMVGQRQERRYEFSGDKLIITSTNPAEHWRVIWKRY